MEVVSGNIFIRGVDPPGLSAGTIVPSHAHNFDHTSYVPRGAVLFEKLDEQDNVVAAAVKRAGEDRNWILIYAGERHRLTILEDGTIYHCLWSHRREEPPHDVVQEYTGWRPGLG